MHYQSILQRVYDDAAGLLGEGKVADYIPALGRIPPDKLGIALHGLDGLDAAVGDANERFSIQSVSKLFSLTLAMRTVGEDLWKRLDREPSGNAFNSLTHLETERGIPRNPFINAGAICVADVLLSALGDVKRELRQFVSELCGEAVSYQAEVAESERRTGFRNAALANFLKSFGNLHNDVDAVLDVYFHQCALAMSCQELARAAAFLANDGISPADGLPVVTERQARRINSLMLTCGTYDAAGEFAFRVGLPCKSGVGGGIVAVVPDTLCVAVWSPALGPSGNSVAGFRALECFVGETGLSVF